MRKKILIITAVVLTALVFTGCPAVLNSDLTSDIMISLGLIRAAEGNTTLSSAVGGEIYVPVLITDQNRTSTTGSYDVDFTLSTDADLSTTGDNIDVDTQTITAGTETMVTLTVPGAAVAATYNLFASFAAASGDPAVMIGTELLNIAVVQVVIGATNEANLAIDIINPPSAFRLPEATFPVSFKVTNDGNKKLASGTEILVEFTIPIVGVDTLVGTTTVTLAEDLLPNDFVTGTATITMPTLAQIAADLGVAEADVEDWSDTVTVWVDPDDTITEITGGDTDTFGVFSGTTKPDLEIAGIDVPAYGIVEGAVEVAVTVENNGYAAADAGSYSLVLFHDADSNGTYDAGTDTVIHTWETTDTPAVPWDPSGGTNNNVVFYTTEIEDLTYPAGMTEGSQDIGAIITGTLDEWDSTNNDGYTSIDMYAAPVDLEVTYISSSFKSLIDPAAADATIPVTARIKNNGTEAVTTDFSVEFFASDNNALNTGSDISIGTATVTEDVPAGKSITVNYNAAFGNGETAGFYTIFAEADSADVVSETDEGNNYETSASNSPVYVVVDDGSDLTARIILYYPTNAPSAYPYHYIAYYDPIWSFDSSNNYYPSTSTGPMLIGSLSITLTNGQDHGVVVENYVSNIASTWRLVPNYVNSINTAYIPNALTRDDSYEDNDGTSTATELSGTANPLFSWVSSYDTASYEYDYYYFYF